MEEWTDPRSAPPAWRACACRAEEAPCLCSIFMNFSVSHSSKALNLKAVISEKLLEHLKQMAVIQEEIGSC